MNIVNYSVCFVVFSLVLNIFMSCQLKSDVKNHSQHQSFDSVQIKIDTVKPLFINYDSLLILLPPNEYKTYRDHFAYISENEYLNIDSVLQYHFDDSISIGFGDDNGNIGLMDSLKLGSEWLCIYLRSQKTKISPKTVKAITESYSYKNMPSDVFPITLLHVENKEYNLVPCDIAFKGDYVETDFESLDQLSVSTETRDSIVNSIQNYVRNEGVIPPRPFATDTLYLDGIYKLTNNTVIAKYKVLEFEHWDGDCGNICLFIVQNNKVVKWLAGMDGDYNTFKLRNKIYIYTWMNTYATSRIELFKINNYDGLDEIYKYVIFGD